ncbi:Ppx/GppA phosphatase family protein [Bacillus massiliigorillae]|uniref:Ppx/GppA phosphatase family protein n=1 Tax=Bacillus massiliigorillae TaxID=1243664 RepID=UPI00039D2245|nr:phosphatase [Bacillus massiliigorillae]
MIYSIIDVGSNTIRLNIYSYKNKLVTSLLHKKTMAGLAGYVVDGYLSPKGIERACTIISNYKSIVENFQIQNVFVFATASLRNIVNTDEVVWNIKERTGFPVDVIAGEEEAKLGFIGASHALTVKDGILVDIGGGSTEITTYEDAKIIKAVSLPIGSLSLYSKYVSKLFPKDSEKEAMKQAVLLELTKLGETTLKEYKILCGVGGSIRATKKLQNNLIFDNETNEFEVATISQLLNLLQKVDKKTLRKVLQVVPDRVHTIIPGMIILQTIATYYGCETIHVSNYGVREGYLYTRVLKEGTDYGKNEEKI